MTPRTYHRYAADYDYEYEGDTADAIALTDRPAPPPATAPDDSVTVDEWDRRRAAVALRLNPALAPLLPDGRMPVGTWLVAARRHPHGNCKPRQQETRDGVLYLACDHCRAMKRAERSYQWRTSGHYDRMCRECRRTEERAKWARRKAKQ